jgi:hypothetical protein
MLLVAGVSAIMSIAIMIIFVTMTPKFIRLRFRDYIKHNSAFLNSLWMSEIENKIRKIEVDIDRQNLKIINIEFTLSALVGVTHENGIAINGNSDRLALLSKIIKGEEDECKSV